jgi:hypothetical protein
VDTSAKEAKRRRGSVPASLALLAAMGSTGTAWFMIYGMAPALPDLTVHASPAIAPVRQVDFDYSASAVLSAELTAANELSAPPIGGALVTSISVHPDTTPSLGDELYRVDDVPVIAYLSDGAIFRTLRPGDRGEDVRAAQAAINAALRVSEPADGIFGSRTSALAREFETMVMNVRATGELRPEWFARLPAPDFRVESVAIDVGDPAPSPGETVLTGFPVLRSVDVESPSTLPDGDYTFTSQGEGINISRAADKWAVTDEDALVAWLRKVVPGAERGLRVDGRIALASPQRLDAVPSPALITGPERVCVLVPDGASAEKFTSVAVKPIDDLANGMTVLRPPSRLTSVVLNPLQAAPDAQCT